MLRTAMIACAVALSAPAANAQTAPRTVVSNVNIVTLDDRGIIASGSVVVANGHIERILHTGERAPRNATVIDGAGGYLIPGLIDAHVHFEAENELAAYLRYGVTTVFSLGDPQEYIEPLIAARRHQAEGTLVGAHLYATGMIIANNIQINSVAEVEPYLDLLQRQGFEYVKIYNEIPQDVFDAVIAGAHRRGMGVFGHMPRRFPPEYTLTHGLNVVAHIEEFFFTTFHGPRDRDLPGLAPDWTPDYSLIDPTLDLVAQNNVAIIPNLVASYTFQNLWADEGRTLDLPDDAVLDRETSAQWRQYNYSRRDQQRFRQIREQIKYPLLRTMTYRAQRRGILLLAGTDAPLPGLYPGRSLQEELRLLVAAGLTNEEALRAATVNGGIATRRWVDHNACIGVIQPGCEADLVLLRGNPLEDIRQTEAIQWVMADGVRHTPEELAQLSRSR